MNSEIVSEKTKIRTIKPKLIDVFEFSWRAVWESRRDRTTHPEGDFDSKHRWYPSARENCGGSGVGARTPSVAYPYSYNRHCRSREHVKNLVRAAMRGVSVPDEVHRVVDRYTAELDAQKTSLGITD